MAAMQSMPNPKEANDWANLCCSKLGELKIGKAGHLQKQLNEVGKRANVQTLRHPLSTLQASPQCQDSWSTCIPGRYRMLQYAVDTTNRHIQSHQHHITSICTCDGMRLNMAETVWLALIRLEQCFFHSIKMPPVQRSRVSASLTSRCCACQYEARIHGSDARTKPEDVQNAVP